MIDFNIVYITFNILLFSGFFIAGVVDWYEKRDWRNLIKGGRCVDRKIEDIERFENI